MPQDQDDDQVKHGFFRGDEGQLKEIVFTEAGIRERYAQVNLHNDSPFRLRHFEGKKEIVVAQKDELGRDYLARSIADVMTRTQPPLTVAVYGRWGEGKTNMLKHVQELLGDRDYAVRTVWFNLWEHQDDVNPMIAMLDAARTAAHSGEGLWAEFDQKSLSTLDARISDVARAVAWTAADIIVPGIVDTVQKYRANKERVLKERFALQDEQTTLRRKFHEALDSLADEKRVAFFIDDLDRCLPDHVVELLEKIKLFMDHEKCVFVIGADRGAVAQAIRETKKYEDEHWAAQYMEKLVQVAFELPPVDEDNKKKFVLGLLDRVSDSEPGMLDENRKNDIAELFDTAFDETDATVRLMIRTVNGFALDHLIGRGFEEVTDETKGEIPSKLWKPRIGTYHPLVMAVFTAIKTCYPGVYEALRARHADRGELLEMLFREPVLPPAIIDHDQADQELMEAERRAIDEQERADVLLSFFNGKEAFLTYVRAFVSYQIADPLQPKAFHDTILTGSSLNAYFGLGGTPGLGIGPREGGGTRDQTIPYIQDVGGKVTPAVGGEVLSWLRAPLLQKSSGHSLKAVRDEVKENEAAHYFAYPPGVWLLENTLGGLQWSIIAHRAGQVLLLSEDVLGSLPYNSALMKVTWEVCTLRKILNRDFFGILGKDIQDAIVPVKQDNLENVRSKAPGGNPTRDYVFLLSELQVRHYLLDRETTDETWNPGKGYSSLLGRLEPWWLRSPGWTSERAMYMEVHDGELIMSGAPVNEDLGVRPAFWLSLV